MRWGRLIAAVVLLTAAAVACGNKAERACAAPAPTPTPALRMPATRPPATPHPGRPGRRVPHKWGPPLGKPRQLPAPHTAAQRCK
jgi:hypothetical protein